MHPHPNTSHFSSRVRGGIILFGAFWQKQMNCVIHTIGIVVDEDISSEETHLSTAHPSTQYITVVIGHITQRRMHDRRQRQDYNKLLSLPNSQISMA